MRDLLSFWKFLVMVDMIDFIGEALGVFPGTTQLQYADNYPWMNEACVVWVICRLFSSQFASLGQTRGGALTWESPELFYDVAVDVSVVVCIWFSTVSN